ncbi:hypothetical protein [Pseudarthrobacter quantipunctorum]|jgi:hypothetical protein|uniref:Bacitracin resistance protein n=1 Tax=Pseudarthrobacter quantipunctorum TaxID=3128980 RepID=A0ABZ2R8X8_9MICC
MNPSPPPGQGKPPKERRDGLLGRGFTLGAFALYALYISATVPIGGPPMWNASYLGGAVAFIPIAVYLTAAILLTVRQKTSQFGAGMLIGLGVFLLFGGGLCIGSLAQSGA